MKMKFKEYIEHCIVHDLEFNAIIGNVDMPVTFCLCEDMEITDYCMEKFGDLLNSECEIQYDSSGRYPDVVVVDYDDYKLGRSFALAISGNISVAEYTNLFNC